MESRLVAGPPRRDECGSHSQAIAPGCLTPRRDVPPARPLCSASGSEAVLSSVATPRQRACFHITTIRRPQELSYAWCVWDDWQMERVHTPVDGRRVGGPAGGTAVPRMKGAAVLSFQRSIGNAAVARLVRASWSSVAPRRLARFVGPEHEDIGNAINVNIDFGNGIVLTWGQVVAIAGDEYGTVERLFADAKDP